MLSVTQQTQEEVERTKQQLSFEMDRIKQESDMKVDGVFALLPIKMTLRIGSVFWFLVLFGGRAPVSRTGRNNLH